VSAPEPSLALFLQQHGLALAGEEGAWTPLTGGVSSDIWRVDTQVGSFCVKRALAKLKVTADWRADTSRNAYEWAYMQVAAMIVPGAVPEPLAHDPDHGLFAMAWLDPTQYRLWKGELLAGRVDVAFASAVGDLMGRLHSATSRDGTLPARFATDDNFRDLRLDPYLRQAARVHAELAEKLHAIAALTAATKLVLVHGDISPKNILIGPAGPVLLDAEVAWFGDPAFDLAFCLNHLVIKARVVQGARETLLEAFHQLAAAYLRRVDWEPREDLEARVANLLPALALARVSGKSPVEYLDAQQRSALTSAASAALASPYHSLLEARDTLVDD
jgi:5-methylthioribose kinase